MIMQGWLQPLVSLLPRWRRGWRRPLVVLQMATGTPATVTDINIIVPLIEKKWEEILASKSTPVTWLQQQLQTPAQRNSFAQLVFPQLAKIRSQFHTRCLQEINKDRT